VVKTEKDPKGEFEMKWYVITPWKRKCIGERLPEAVIKHARCVAWNVYFLKNAVVMTEPPKGEDLK